MLARQGIQTLDQDFGTPVGIFDIVAFGILLVSSVYGRMSGHLSSLSAVFDAMSYGVSRSAPLFVLYVVLVQLYASLRFVFL